MTANEAHPSTVYQVSRRIFPAFCRIARPIGLFYLLIGPVRGPRRFDRSAPSSARLCSGLMLMMATVIRTRVAPSPEIGARDTALDGAANGSAGVDCAPNVDAGINGATHLSGHRGRDHEDDGRGGTDCRKLPEHQ
jgi:hypothetical protein